MGAYEDARSIAQILLDAEPSPVARETIEAKVHFALGGNPNWRKDLDASRLVEELVTLCATRIGLARTLEDNSDHRDWLPARKPELNWSFWSRYDTLQRKRLPTGSRRELGRITDDILGRLEDPRRKGQWDRRGLVVGHVQSGKTANYVGLICKAADAGYQVIIVLAGIHKSLRSQTQIRLDEGFLGYDSDTQASQGKVPVGVGIIDGAPEANTITTRDDDGDFKRSAAKNSAFHPGGKPLLFVVKKNASVLRNLLKWVQFVAKEKDRHGHEIVSGVPLLMIDDEADHASVDTRAAVLDETGKPDKEHDPATINSLIRKLLRSFEKRAYVGYTATPFANIFIHDKGVTDEEDVDLFPRSFITNLSAPSNYFGPVRVFGMDPDPSRDLEGVEPLPLVRYITDHADSLENTEREGWMPPLHNRAHEARHEGGEELPGSLREAIQAFVLTVAARQLRGHAREHNSMLVHVTRYTDVQTQVFDQVSKELEGLTRRLVRGEGQSPKGAWRELEELWTTDFVPTTRALKGKSVAWKDIAAILPAVARSIQVKKINGTAADILDYEAHRTVGLNVIAVGGDKLSRGLTLEGLSVSYFLRASKMYDTLMQMGRWFGYRPGYEDLCRLYMTEDLEDWFRLVTAASEELREEFDQMVRQGRTPLEYGLRVRRHPGLLITAPVKMRTGLDLELSYQGAIVETIVFQREAAHLEANLQATATLLEDLPGMKLSPTQPRPAGKKDHWVGTRVWDDVPAKRIVDFLRAFHTHPGARRVNGALMAQYIEKQLRAKVPELTGWTVALVHNSAAATHVEVAGFDVGPMKRSWYPERSGKKNDVAESDPYPIRRLVSPREEAIDLGSDAYRAALAETVKNWSPDHGRSDRDTEPVIPSGPSLRAQRPKERGLLLLYPLDPVRARVAGGLPPIGVAVSFPASTTAHNVAYRVTNLYWDQEFGPET